MTTRTNPITLDVIQRAIDGIDALGSYELRTSYRGRGMSRPCVGVVVESPAALLALGASIAWVIANNTSSAEDSFAAADAIDDAIQPLSQVSIDNMGRDLIAYWPGVSADA